MRLFSLFCLFLFLSFSQVLAAPSGSESAATQPNKQPAQGWQNASEGDFGNASPVTPKNIPSGTFSGKAPEGSVNGSVDGTVDTSMEVDSPRYSRARTWEDKWDEISYSSQKLRRELSSSKTQLQTLHTASELSVILKRNPDWKVKVDKYTIAEDGTITTQWEISGRELLQELLKGGIDPSQLQWGGITVPIDLPKPEQTTKAESTSSN